MHSYVAVQSPVQVSSQPGLQEAKDSEANEFLRSCKAGKRPDSHRGIPPGHNLGQYQETGQNSLFLMIKSQAKRKLSKE